MTKLPWPRKIREKGYIQEDIKEQKTDTTEIWCTVVKQELLPPWSAIDALGLNLQKFQKPDGAAWRECKVNENERAPQQERTVKSYQL